MIMSLKQRSLKQIRAKDISGTMESVEFFEGGHRFWKLTIAVDFLEI